MAIQPIRLSQLTNAITDRLKSAFGSVTFWVIADVTNHSFRAEKNYHNFELVEKDPHSNTLMARIQAKAWGKGATNIQHFELQTGQRFSNNINVLVNVSVNFHSVYGLQLNLNEIDINFTLGALEQQRLATLAKLIEENPDFIRKAGDQIITRNKELLYNKVIQRIAVVSSKTSAGWQDFRHTLETNSFGYTFFVDDYFTVVQGENNAEQFLTRLIDVFHSNKVYDAVVIIRGGGAQTDFLIFDSYRIGKAIAKFPIPVITGIGHHKNETIADLMAHTQTKTPTRAAEFIIDHNRSFEDTLSRFRQQIVIKTQQKISRSFSALSQVNSLIVNESRDIVSSHKDRLYRLQSTVVSEWRSVLFNANRALLLIGSAILTKPIVIINDRLRDIDQLASNVGRFSAGYVKNQKGQLAHYIALLKVLSPESALKRGFAIVKSKNKVTSNPDDLVIGADIEILLANKSITTTVKSKKDYDGREFDL